MKTIKMGGECAVEKTRAPFDSDLSKPVRVPVGSDYQSLYVHPMFASEARIRALRFLLVRLGVEINIEEDLDAVAVYNVKANEHRWI